MLLKQACSVFITQYSVLVSCYELILECHILTIQYLLSVHCGPCLLSTSMLSQTATAQWPLESQGKAQMLCKTIVADGLLVLHVIDFSAAFSNVHQQELDDLLHKKKISKAMDFVIIPKRANNEDFIHWKFCLFWFEPQSNKCTQTSVCLHSKEKISYHLQHFNSQKQS